MTPVNKNFSKNMLNTLSPRARGLYERYAPDGKSSRGPRGNVAVPKAPPAAAGLKKYFPDELNGKVSSSHLAPAGDIRESIKNDPERKRLYKTAVEFQSIFVNMMLKSMRQTLNKKDDILNGGFRQDVFEDMLYDKYAKLMSQNSGFSLAEQMYRQLEPGMGVSRPAAQTTAAGDYEKNIPGSPSSTLSTSRMYRR